MSKNEFTKLLIHSASNFNKNIPFLKNLSPTNKNALEL